jgi:hypothetical protein
MCPFCLATVAAVVAGVVSTGGLTAMVRKAAPGVRGTASKPEGNRTAGRSS